MAIIQSAKKAIRSSARKRAFNLVHKNEVGSLIKNIKKLILEKKKKEAEILLPKVYKAIDKACKTNFIKKNTASRKKSRIAIALGKI